MKRWLEKFGKKKAEEPAARRGECKVPIYTSGGWLIGTAWKYEPELTHYLLWTKPHGHC